MVLWDTPARPLKYRIASIILFMYKVPLNAPPVASKVQGELVFSLVGNYQLKCHRRLNLAQDIRASVMDLKSAFCSRLL